MQVKLKCFFIITILLSFSMTKSYALSKVAIKAIYECVENATKKSNRVLSVVEKKAAIDSLKSATQKYGDDVIKLANKGGLESIEQGVKYGDEFWRLSSYSPNVAKSLLINSDEMMKIARKSGDDFLRFETKHSGFALQTVKTFGDDSLKNLVNASDDDLIKLLGYGNKADSVATKNLLYTTYNGAKNKSGFLKALNWKHIMAGGLSAAMITSAYKVSNGVEDGLVKVADKSPKDFIRIIYFAIIVTGIVFLFKYSKYSAKKY